VADRDVRPCVAGRGVLTLPRMFVRYFADLAAPFDEVEARLLDAPQGWLPGILEGAEDRGARLLADVGFHVRDEVRVERQVDVTIGEVYRMTGKSLVPITWAATGGGRLFPSLEGDIEVASLGEHRTQLSISARYEPPLGAVGRVLDRAVLHRVAEATVKDFLDRVAETVGASNGEGGPRS
jgi:hypothetical protein